MDSKFFTFLEPFLKFIDDGHFFRQPFSWLYTLLAWLSLLSPFYFLYQGIEIGVFDAPAKMIILYLFFLIIICLAGWVGFQIWWNRRLKVTVTSKQGDEFVATPVFSHFIQTLGEWIGTWIAFVGFFSVLLSLIFLGDNADRLFWQLGLDFMHSGLWLLLILPIYGFLIVVFTRFLAEMFRAFTSIANNTKKA